VNSVDDKCIFCSIADGTIPCRKAYEDAEIIAFHDITPQAPVHILIIPKKHIDSIADIESSDFRLVSRIFEVANKLASDLDIQSSGFRIVINKGQLGGQSVGHLHVHLLGGRQMKWPPG
jgi:histidine triad (HIT) family protein